MAIMLHEEGLYDKARIYATDMNDRSLQQAKEGVYGIEKMKLFTTNYLEAGGTSSLLRVLYSEIQFGDISSFSKEEHHFRRAQPGNRPVI